MDFRSFTSSEFDHVHWINDNLKPLTNDLNIDQKVSEMVVQLQSRMNDAMQMLDRTCHEATSCVPRIIRELDSLRSDSIVLDEELQSLQQNIVQVDKQTDHLLKHLTELDLMRRNSQSVATVLRETDRWSHLMRCCKQEFSTSNDIDQLCCYIEGLEQSLSSLNHFPDYEDRVKCVEDFKNSFESLIAPQLIQALDVTVYPAFDPVDYDMNSASSPTSPSVRHLINLLHRIGRLEAAHKYYLTWLKNQMTKIWHCLFDQTEIHHYSDDELMKSSIVQLSTQYAHIFTHTSNEQAQEASLSSAGCLTLEQLSLDKLLLIEKFIQFFSVVICLFCRQLNMKAFSMNHVQNMVELFADSWTHFSDLHKFVQNHLVAPNDDPIFVGDLLKITVTGCIMMENYLFTYLSDNSCTETLNSLRHQFIQLIKAVLNPFDQYFDSHAKYLRAKFSLLLTDSKKITTSDSNECLLQLRHVLKQTFTLFNDAMQLCFIQTGGLLIPFLLDIIHCHWQSVVTNWLAPINEIAEQLMKSDCDSGYKRAEGFGCLLKFANLTGELGLQADEFVELILSQSHDWFVDIFHSSDNILCKYHSPNEEIEISQVRPIIHQMIVNRSCGYHQTVRVLACLPLSATSDISGLQNGEPIRSNLDELHRTSGMACRAIVNTIRQVALLPVRKLLQPVPQLTVWFSHPSSGLPCLPDLAYLPQDHITQIGQYLFALLTQLEPYLSSEETNLDLVMLATENNDLTSSGRGLSYTMYLGDPESSCAKNILQSTQQQTDVKTDQHSETTSTTHKLNLLSNQTSNSSAIFSWLESLIAGGVCDLIINAIIRIGTDRSVEPKSKTAAHECDTSESDEQHSLTEHGIKQLNVDLNYFFNMLHDLGVAIPKNLLTLRDLLNCEMNDFQNLSADRPPRIVNSVALLRGL